MTTVVYLEGGGDSKELRVRCREGFRKLLANCGFAGRMPRLVACGGRDAAYDDFKTAHAQAGESYVGLLIDSEDPVAALSATWEHLKLRPGDGWERPLGATDDQVLFMTTCMETWIISDRGALKQHYGAHLQETALPALHDLERRPRGDVQEALTRATRNCSNAYIKGKRSFEVLAKLDPAILEQHLPSFARARNILEQKLQARPTPAW